MFVELNSSADHPGTSKIEALFTGPDARNDAKVYSLRASKSRAGVLLSLETKTYFNAHFGECHKVIAIYRDQEPDQATLEEIEKYREERRKYLQEQEEEGEKKSVKKIPKRRHKEQKNSFGVFLRPEEEKFSEPMEKLEKPRNRYQKGWRDLYIPTRARYWEPRSRNWKCFRKTPRQYKAR